MNAIAIDQMPASALLLGSGLIALGASIVVAASLTWWRKRRDTATQEPIAAGEVDLRDEVAAAPTEAKTTDLRQIDTRLDDLETCLLTLTARVDSLLRQRSEPELRSTHLSPVERATDAPSAEFEMLRALAARGE